MEPQKTLSRQSNLEKEKQRWKHQNSGLQVKLQSCSNQNSMVLAQKQTHRLGEQNRKSRNKTTTIWSINPSTREKRICNGKNKVSSRNGAQKTGEQGIKE